MQTNPPSATFFATQGKPTCVRLSLCMIVRNEEVCLAGCLQSVASLVDEIIIVDTGSTDRTVALAKAYGASVYHHLWESNFALARNQSLSYAQGDWILVMDADERLSAEAQHWLAQFKQSAPDPVVYHLQIVNLDDQHQPASCYFMQRLFPRDARLRFEGLIHENLSPDSQALPACSLTLPFFEHLGQQSQHQVRQAKAERNLSLLLAASQQQPDDPHVGYHLGNAYRNLGQIPQAVQCFEHVLASRNEGVNPEHPMYAQALSECLEALLALRQPQAAIQLAEQHLCQHLPPSYWYYLGQAYRQQKKQLQAQQCFESALMMDPLRSGQSLPFTHEIAHMRQLPLLQLCYLYQFQTLEPVSSLDSRRQCAQLRMKVLLNLIDLFPDGTWPQLHMNLYLQFAEALLLSCLLASKTYTKSAFTEPFEARFRLQPHFQAVRLAWQELTLPSDAWLQPASDLQQISRYWLQGIGCKQAHLHAQIWQDFASHFSDEVQQSLRLISALLLNQDRT